MSVHHESQKHQPIKTQNNKNRQQDNFHCAVEQQQAFTPQRKYSRRNQQEIFWIRPLTLLQSTPVRLFNRDFFIEIYALLDNGSDNTQITQKVAEAYQVQQPKDIILPLAPPHGDHDISCLNSVHHEVKLVVGLRLWVVELDRHRQPSVIFVLSLPLSTSA